MEGKRVHGSHLLLLLLVTAALFWQFFLLGRDYTPADFLTRLPFWYDPVHPEAAVHNFDLFDAIVEYYPQFSIAAEAWRAGHPPLWDPYSLCGYPLLASSHVAGLYPPRALLFALLDLPLAIDLTQILHVFLSGLAMWLFMRKRGAAPFGSAVAAVAWMLSGPCMAWMELIEIGGLAVGLPLTLWLLADGHAGRRTSYAWAGVALGVMFWTGQSPYALYVWMVAALYAVYLLGEKWRQTGQRRDVLADALALGGTVLVGGLLACAQVLPTLQLAADSQRPTMPIDYLITTHRQFLAGLPATMLFPDLFGNPADGFALRRIFTGGYFTFMETHGYVGVLTIFAFLVGAVAARRRDGAFFLWLAAAVLIVPATPLYGLLYHSATVWQRLVPTRMLVIVSFCVVVVAGLGADMLAARRLRLAWMAWSAGLLALGWAAALLWADGWLGQPAHLDALVHRLLAGGFVRLPDRSLFLDDAAHLSAVTQAVRAYPTTWSAWKPCLWLGGCAVLALVARWPARTAGGYRQPRVPDAAWRTLALGLLVADLVSWGAHFNTAVPRAAVYPPAPVLEWIKAQGSDEAYRVLGIASVKPCTTVPARVMDVAGYDSLYPGVMATVLSRAENSAVASVAHPYFNQVFPITHADSRLWNIMAARWIVAYPDVTLPADRFTPRFEHRMLRVYENRQALPRAWYVPAARTMPRGGEADERAMLDYLDGPRFDPRREVVLERPTAAASSPPPDAPATCRITRAGLERVTLVVDAPADGWAVLADTWYPGWDAQLDGKPVPLLRANFFARAVAVPRGTHVVEMRYAPPAFRAGRSLAGLGLFAALVWAVVAWRRQRPA